jgi:cytochrome b
MGMVARTERRGQRWVPVWDPFVRIFHCSTVGLFAIAFYSDESRLVHDTAGYLILILVMMRLAWGLVGPRHARFSDFIASPQRVVQYLRDLRAGRARRYLGHNPAGGAMIAALLALLLITAGSGWLSQTDAFFGIGWISHLHHRAAYLLLVLAAAHVIGVIVSSRLHGENLMLAMLTGRKRNESSSEAQAEHGTAIGPSRSCHRAAMRCGDLGDDREPQAGTG